MQAYILINVGDLGHYQELLGTVHSITEIMEVTALFGPWDMIAKVKVDKLNDLAKITSEIRKLDCVKETQVLIAHESKI